MVMYFFLIIISTERIISIIVKEVNFWSAQPVWDLIDNHSTRDSKRQKVEVKDGA